MRLIASVYHFWSRHNTGNKVWAIFRNPYK